MHMIKSEATIIHLQRKERSFKKPLFCVSWCFRRSSNCSADKGLFAQSKTTI